MTDTAKYADILLPATFSVEQTDCYTSYGYCSFGTAKKVITPPGECKSNWDTFCLLAAAMGYEDDYFKQTEEEMLEDLLSHPLEGLGLASVKDRNTLRAGDAISSPFDEHCNWKTKTGKIQIINEALPEPMPRYIENHGGDFPLKLVAVPSCDTLNSIFLERKELVDHRGSMWLAIHPEDARKRNIKEGDKVVAFNDLAEVGFIAKVTDMVAKGAVAAEGVYPVALSVNGRLVNALHHERLTDMGEASTLNDNTVEIKTMV